MKKNKAKRIRPHNLRRRAVAYLRRSSRLQKARHLVAVTHQRDQQEYARRWGWPAKAITVIAEDTGWNGSSSDNRPGYQRLHRMVGGAGQSDPGYRPRPAFPVQGGPGTVPDAVL